MRARRGATLLLGLLLIVGLGSAFLVAARQPLGGGDYVAIWGLKARALHRSGTLASLSHVDPAGTFSHQEYPPAWPLLLSATARLAGGYDEWLLGFLRPALLVLSALLAARATRAPPPFPLLSAAVLSLLPFYRTGLYGGYAEPLLVFALLAALAAADRLDRPSGLALLALSLALATLTKNEGALAGLVAAVVLLAGRRFVASAVAGVAVLLAAGGWSVVRLAHGGPGALSDFSLSAFDLGKPVAALGALAREMGPAGLLWAAGGASLLWLAPRTRASRRGVLATALFHATLLLGAFAFARVDVAWLVRWSWDRLALPLVAVFVVLLSEALHEILDAGGADLAPRDPFRPEFRRGASEDLAGKPVDGGLPQDP